MLFRLFPSFADVDPSRKSGVLFQLRNRQFNGAVAAAAGRKNSFKAAEAFVQIHLHALLHCKGAYAANSMANVLRYGVMRSILALQ